MRNLLGRLLGSASAPEEHQVVEKVERDIPIVWLLGNTGAGKSSLIKALTGLDDVQVGNGYASCTRTSRKFDFPQEEPLVRFLDTRGLGEAGYDPTEDLAACEGHSHAIIVVAKLNDQVQGQIADALSQVIKRRPNLDVMLVHTGADLVPDLAQRERTKASTSALIRKALGRDIIEVSISLPPDTGPSPEDFAELTEALVQVLPNAGLLLHQEATHDAESKAFREVRKTVLFYAGVAGGSDVFPIVGLLSSTGVQFTMLKKLGEHYGIPVTIALARNFAYLLGVGIGGRFLGSVALRQGAKLIPGYGQTVGAVAAGTFTFAATYALGRTAARYLHTLSIGETPSREDMQDTFRNAFKGAQKND